MSDAAPANPAAVLRGRRWPVVASDRLWLIVVAAVAAALQVRLFGRILLGLDESVYLQPGVPLGAA